MEETSASNLKPKKALYKRWWFWAVIVFVIIIGYLIVGSTIQKTADHFFSLTDLINKSKCETRTSHHYNIYDGACYLEYPDGQKLCTQNDQCISGKCWSGFTKVDRTYNDDGYLQGKCKSIIHVNAITGEEIPEQTTLGSCYITQAGKKVDGKNTAVIDCIEVDYNKIPF